MVQEVQGLLDRSGLQVLPEPLAVKVLLVPRVSRDQTEIQDQQVPQDRKEYKALPDMQVCQGSSETLAQLVLPLNFPANFFHSHSSNVMVITNFFL